MHGERTPPTIPPCDGCMVDLAEENEDAARIFQIVRGQVRTRFNGQHDDVIDLDFNAVKMAMDLYQIHNQREVFEKVRATFFHFLNEGSAE
jgi:hypothetical protein